MKQLKIDLEKLECMANRLKAIGHPLRIAIIDMLEKKERMSVSDIQANLNIEQASTSHHLRILKDQNILGAQRDGKHKYYFLKERDLIEQIVICMEKCK